MKIGRMIFQVLVHDAGELFEGNTVIVWRALEQLVHKNANRPQKFHVSRTKALVGSWRFVLSSTPSSVESPRRPLLLIVSVISANP